jgi:ABC-type branched-subunit amino acid transport system ATPase component
MLIPPVLGKILKLPFKRAEIVFMGKNQLNGMTLFHKTRPEDLVLKDLLRFLKTVNRGKNSAFFYVEAETSLLPHLDLWENIQLVSGSSTWKDFKGQLTGELLACANLLTQPHILASEAEPWQKFLVSLITGMLSPAPYLLIDMNENLYSPLILQNLKKQIGNLTQTKDILLTSSNTSLWLDSAHRIVCQKGFEFEIEKLDEELTAPLKAA